MQRIADVVAVAAETTACTSARCALRGSLIPE
jgi:hypothetical protein